MVPHRKRRRGQKHELQFVQACPAGSASFKIWLDARLAEQVEQAVGLKWIRAFDFVWQGARLKGRAYRMFRSA
jgi:hypothetical protein